MRCVLFVLLVLSLWQSDVTRIRLLLRDEMDAGVAFATVMLRTEDGQAFSVTADASGVAITDALSGSAVWLVGGQRADGTALQADSYPADAGFRLVLIANQTRNVLVRLDGEQIVLDPDMIFSPGDPGEAAPPTPIQFAATALPLTTATAVGTPAVLTSLPAASSSQSEAVSLWILATLVLSVIVVLLVAFLIGLAQRERS